MSYSHIRPCGRYRDRGTGPSKSQRVSDHARATTLGASWASTARLATARIYVRHRGWSYFDGASVCFLGRGVLNHHRCPPKMSKRACNGPKLQSRRSLTNEPLYNRTPKRYHAATGRTSAAPACEGTLRAVARDTCSNVLELPGEAPPAGETPQCNGQHRFCCDRARGRE